MTPFVCMRWRAFTEAADDHAILDLDGEVYKLPVPATTPAIMLRVGTFTPVTAAAAATATWPTERLLQHVLGVVPTRGEMSAPDLDAAQKLRRLDAVRRLLSTTGPIPSPTPFNDRRTPVVNHLVALAARAYGLDDASVVDCLKAIGVDVTITDVALSRQSGFYDADEAGKSLDAAAELQAHATAKAAREAHEAAERAAERKPYTSEDFPGVVLFARTSDQDTLNYGATEMVPVGRIARALPRSVMVRVLDETNETILAARTLGIAYPAGPLFDGLRVLGPGESFDLTLAEAQTVREAPIFHGQTAMQAFRKARRPTREAMTPTDSVQPATAEFKHAKVQFAGYIEALRHDVTNAGITGGCVLPLAEIGVRGLRLPADVVAHQLTRAFSSADGQPHWLFHSAHWTQLATMASSPGMHLVHPGELLQAPPTLTETVMHGLDVLKEAFGTHDKVARTDVVNVLARAGASTDDSAVTKLMASLGFGASRRVGKGASRKRMFVRKSLDVTPVAKPAAVDPFDWRTIRSGKEPQGGWGSLAPIDVSRAPDHEDTDTDEDEQTPDPEATFADVERQAAEVNARAREAAVNPEPPIDEAAL